MKKYLFILAVVFESISCLAGNNNFCLAGNSKEIDLSGRWLFSTTGTTFDASVSLPGTTDTNGLGETPQRTDETTHLTRLHYFVGKAWYRRTFTVGKDWKGKKVFLHLERTKPSTVWIDGDSIGSSNDISTPQVYNLGKLKPGVHTLTIRVDKSMAVCRLRSCPVPMLIRPTHRQTGTVLLGESFSVSSPRLILPPKYKARKTVSETLRSVASISMLMVT